MTTAIKQSTISRKEAAKVIQEMKRFTKTVSSSKAAAERFLNKTGIYTASGALKSHYK